MLSTRLRAGRWAGSPDLAAATATEASRTSFIGGSSEDRPRLLVVHPSRARRRATSCPLQRGALRVASQAAPYLPVRSPRRVSRAGGSVSCDPDTAHRLQAQRAGPWRRQARFFAYDQYDHIDDDRATSYGNDRRRGRYASGAGNGPELAAAAS